MPKLKTKRAAAKRFHATGTGKLKRFKAYKSHILTKKTTKRISRKTIAILVQMNRMRKRKRMIAMRIPMK